MDPYIALLGNAADPDRMTLAAIAQTFGIEVREHSSASPSDGVPIGCLSFLPSTKQSCIDLFAVMPLGTGYEIPFFQRIDAQQDPDYFQDFPIYGVFSSPLSAMTARNMVSIIVRQNALMAQNKDWSARSSNTVNRNTSSLKSGRHCPPKQASTSFCP